MIDKYMFIMNHFGPLKQAQKIEEESKEIIEAINEIEEMFDKGEDYNDEDFFEQINAKRVHVVEEMGDLLNVLSQFIFLYDIEKKELDSVMNFKVDRTIQRINEGYYDK